MYPVLLYVTAVQYTIRAVLVRYQLRILENILRNREVGGWSLGYCAFYIVVSHYVLLKRRRRRRRRRRRIKMQPDTKTYLFMRYKRVVYTL